MIDPAQLLSSIGIDRLWLALNEDSEARVGITSSDGTILWANAISRHRHAERHDGSLVGKNVFELVTEGVGSELRDARNRASRTGDAVVIETVVNGVQTRLTYRAFSLDHQPCFLVVARDMDQPLQTDGSRGDDHAVLHTTARDLGPLEVLTRRELEILALIGEHLPAQKIAERLGRSVKTVDWHRVSIGHKLGVRTRGELALIARRAGLVAKPPPSDPGETKRAD